MQPAGRAHPFTQAADGGVSGAAAADLEERLYRDGSKKGVQPAHVPKVLRSLSALDVAQAPDDLAIPSFRTRPLKGDLTGQRSIWVNGNWRVTFRFVDNDVELVDYQGYH